MLNPCLECDHHLNGGDKNSAMCADCNDRILYDHHLSGVSIEPEMPMPPAKPHPKPIITEYPEGTTRTCNKCGKTKPLDEFRRNESCVYGREPVCKECKNASARAKTAAKSAAKPTKPKTVKTHKVKALQPSKQTVELPPYEPTPQDEWLKGRCLDIATAIYSHLKECDDCDHPLEAWALELARTLRARNDIMKATVEQRRE